MGTLFRADGAVSYMEREDSAADGDPVEDRQTGHPDETEYVNVTAMNYWDRVIEDMEATAEEYEEEGWETHQLHPGDIHPLAGDEAGRVGLDVLVPDDEYEAVEALFAEGIDFDNYRVYKNQQGSVVFALVAMEDSSSGHAVLLPLFYSVSDESVQTVLEQARKTGVLKSYVRRLQGDYIELTHENPELFQPPSED